MLIIVLSQTATFFPVSRNIQDAKLVGGVVTAVLVMVLIVGVIKLIVLMIRVVEFIVIRGSWWRYHKTRQVAWWLLLTVVLFVVVVVVLVGDVDLRYREAVKCSAKILSSYFFVVILNWYTSISFMICWETKFINPS